MSELKQPSLVKGWIYEKDQHILVIMDNLALLNARLNKALKQGKEVKWSDGVVSWIDINPVLNNGKEIRHKDGERILAQKRLNHKFPNGEIKSEVYWNGYVKWAKAYGE